MTGERIKGNGQVTTRQMTTGAFTSIEARGSMTIRLKQDAKMAVEVETDENIFPYLDIRIDGSTLIIDTKRNVNLSPTNDLVVNVSAPIFRRIQLSGSGDLEAVNKIMGDQPLELQTTGSGNLRMELDVNELTTQTSGSGNMELRGRADRLEARVSGSGEFKARDLVSETATVRASGSGGAEVRVEKQLNAQASGSGSITYSGGANVNSQVSGSGSVDKQ